MNGIDELLHDATERLDLALVHTTAPKLATTPRRPGRVVVRLACLVALAAAGYAITVRIDGRDSVTSAPPGLLEGRYGSPIVMTEVADGDDDPQTFTLFADPNGGTVNVTNDGEGSAPTTTLGGSQGLSFVEVCITSSGAGGYCGPRAMLESPQMLGGTRGANGQAVVIGLPSNTYAVIFTAGTTIHWSTPLHGIVAFPYPQSAAQTATAEAVDRSGAVLWQQSATDPSMTASEVAAAVVTQPSTDVLASGWFGEPIGSGHGPEVVRLHGRNALTGFDGPFTAQGYALDNDAPGVESWVWAITVRTSDVAAVSDRLDELAGGAIRDTLEPTPDVRVVIWAGADVAESEVDRFNATLSQRAALADRTVDLDVPTSWTSDHTPASSLDESPLNALVTDTIGRVDGHDIIAHADDVGQIKFHLAGVEGSYTIAGGPAGLNPLPPNGEQLSAVGLRAIPTDTVSVEFTLDDGTTLTPELVDARPLLDAKLLFTLGPDKERTIASVITDTTAHD